MVGGSDTSLSLLEHLVFNPHLHFSNILLISPHGLPQTTPTGHTQTYCSTKESLSLLGLRVWVSVVRGRLIGLDRESKSVTVESSEGSQQSPTLLHYDYLVLCTGLQYQPPELPYQPQPRHLFTVNDRHDELQLMQWVQERMTKRLQGMQPSIRLHTKKLEFWRVHTPRAHVHAVAISATMTDMQFNLITLSLAHASRAIKIINLIVLVHTC